MRRKLQGFTLIELLVVIAIIGILSAVVLVALGIARARGQDASLQTTIKSIVNQAAIYHIDNSSYGTNVSDESECDPAVATDNMFSDPIVAQQVAAADAANQGGSVTCNVAADGAAYAVSAELNASPGTYFCVDSAGNISTGATALGVDTVCP